MLPAVIPFATALLGADPPRVLDSFERLDPWTVHAADGVVATVASGRGQVGRALRLDFEFRGGGYAIVRRQLALDLPPNYAFSFRLKGVASPNTLEFKLIDASGENVWWYTERDRSFDGAWHTVTVRRRQISFAWGPAGGGELRHVAAIELVITAGRGGGRGSVWFDELVLTPLPDLGPYDGIPIARATSLLAEHPPAALLDGDSVTAWRSRPDASRASITLDFQRSREFGGLTLRWEPGRAARRYDVQLSDDGRTWRNVRRVRHGNGGRDDLFLPDSEGRYLRLGLAEPEGAHGFGLCELVVQPLEFGATRNAFFTALAAGYPRGTWPRYFSGERAYWTVVGVDGAREEALFNEDGAVEVGAGGFSIEPFLRTDRLITWADVQRRVWLEQGELPIPTVEWLADDLALTVTPFAIGPAERSSVVVRYRVTNRGDSLRSPRLDLAIRPFQVNPPWQFLTTPGGVARIDSLRWDGRSLRVNGSRQLQPLVQPASVGITPLDAGEIVEHLRLGKLPAATQVRDSAGAGSAVLEYSLSVPARGSAEVAIEIPLVPGGAPHLTPGQPVAPALADAVAGWQRTLAGSDIVLPASGDHLARTMRSTRAWILINRDGPALQPGSRSYERSWIRDGALTSAALLRFGHAATVRAFIEWYAGFQYPNGKVPCCVDTRGADPVPEHDSHGEFIYLVMEYWRHTGDHELLRALWPHVRNAVSYIDSLRQSRRTAEFEAGDNARFYGLLPPSISHEGYSAKPMHSYWDDFFALRGLRDAASMAQVLGLRDEAARISAMRDEFRTELRRSLDRVMTHFRIDYLPGAADLGDYDPTSTTIAIAPGGELEALPRVAVDSTFARYWRSARARPDSSGWDAYTPYELRTVGTLLRLGWKDRALELLQLFLADQEPPDWNQWPEVVFRDRRAPRFIGDSPHTWVGSDFLRSAADLFVYERESDSTLVLGAGIGATLLEGKGVQVKQLSTWWGPLSYEAVREGTAIRFQIAGGVRVPTGGILIRSPRAGAPARALVDDAPADLVEGNGVRVRRVPANVEFQY